MSLYPNNTIANYKVQLARPLQFEQLFEVAINEFIYSMNKSFVDRGKILYIYIYI